METRIERITPQSVEEAKTRILCGEVVAIPTETVYGLGGNAFDDGAVKKIFEVKGRPNDNPLIAHIHKDYDLTRIIDGEPPYAAALREAFLPGPLTLVYPSKGRVSAYVSCGLDTLAVRVPKHEGAQALLRALDVPVVAPSANLSKHVSPTSAAHVYDDFNGKIPLILDGGECEGGIESTVLDVTGEVPVILRPGLITREMIAAVVGECEESTATPKAGEKVKSPGVLYKHYSPRCKTAYYTSVERAVERYREERAAGNRAAVLCEGQTARALARRGVKVFDLGDAPTEMATKLYGLLREAETKVDTLVAIEPTPDGGVMTGVKNRLKKACASVDIPH